MPRAIEVMKIAVDKIREVIGSGGKVIREIVEKDGAKINIEDDGHHQDRVRQWRFDQGRINWIKSSPRSRGRVVL